ncbi:uncharacterized protein BX663DRAFT_508947 [Cokeromyces recurvatus]|uniref:uncharacterized protein n=1 Tax=Cokeromyces recurvatus TaxID=90255 RepID=UPI00222021B1|nr:uncharacterized protein BX663DRAFT_508947 [Cokeromyces recurvatus]KAI7902939.1 hypothetical protein BX663DRAFT_508947 [Cokeromyces recurvatus]
MAETGRIYSAVYSGVPVFETIINGVAVMRRQTDSFMNATQILKVANIEKGKRTKILEKEVLIGEHEKVQGGYGKYQGTWIPFNKSREIAEKYGVKEVLAPIMDFDMDSVNSQTGLNTLLTKEQAIVAGKKSAHQTSQPMTTTPVSAQPVQESPQIHLHLHLPTQQQIKIRNPTNHDEHSSSPARKKTKIINQQSEALSSSIESSMLSPSTQIPLPAPIEAINEAAADERNRNLLMSIFLSDKPEQIPDLLSIDSHSTTNKFNIDMVIDEQGNTALHWATALARVNTVELLVSRSANIACRNFAGETPLIRGVMVTNNYDNHCFHRVFDLLKESVNIFDNRKRSAIHHAALTAGIQGRVHAAIYYMKTLVDYVVSCSENPKLILDAQDDMGDTALMIAARLECQPLISILMEAGATKKAQNNIGLGLTDYNTTMKEDSPMEEASHPQRIFSNTSSYSKRPYAPSQRGKEIVATVQKIVDALDEEYGEQISAKEQELQRLDEELNAVTRELETTRKGLEERQAQSQQLSEVQQKTRNIEAALQTGWDQLEHIMKQGNKAMPSPEDIDRIDENEDIDTIYFGVPQLVIDDTMDEKTKKDQLEAYVNDLQAKVKAYTANDLALQQEIHKIEAQFVERELQCKRLIAACCNLPIDKIDELVEPLTLAIESDPPDLDLARVIGFMDKIRRQGGFSEQEQQQQSNSNIFSGIIPHSPQPESSSTATAATVQHT